MRMVVLTYAITTVVWKGQTPSCDTNESRIASTVIAVHPARLISKAFVYESRRYKEAVSLLDDAHLFVCQLLQLV